MLHRGISMKYINKICQEIARSLPWRRNDKSKSKAVMQAKSNPEEWGRYRELGCMTAAFQIEQGHHFTHI